MSVKHIADLGKIIPNGITRTGLTPIINKDKTVDYEIMIMTRIGATCKGYMWSSQNRMYSHIAYNDTVGSVIFPIPCTAEHVPSEYVTAIDNVYHMIKK